MAGWVESGGAIESGGTIGLAARPATSPARIEESRARGGRSALDRVMGVFDRLSNRSLGGVLGVWLGWVFAFALVYWISSRLGAGSVQSRPAELRDLGTAVYFSFMTALTVGYGDVVPHGVLRALAVIEATGGFLLFGALISRLVSRRQEQLTQEIHDLTFEGQLGRVRTNLHLAISELQAIESETREGHDPPARLLARGESIALVFLGELRTVHKLLYQPEHAPDELSLEGILANLAAALEELRDLIETLKPVAPPSPTLRGHLTEISRLAAEICGDCVPREYAGSLKSLMDRIQSMASSLRA